MLTIASHCNSAVKWFLLPKFSAYLNTRLRFLVVFVWVHNSVEGLNTTLIFAKSIQTLFLHTISIKIFFWKMHTFFSIRKTSSQVFCCACSNDRKLNYSHCKMSELKCLHEVSKVTHNLSGLVIERRRAKHNNVFQAQRNWIGRNDGAVAKHPIEIATWIVSQTESSHGPNFGRRNCSKNHRALEWFRWWVLLFCAGKFWAIHCIHYDCYEHWIAKHSIDDIPSGKIATLSTCIQHSHGFLVAWPGKGMNIEINSQIFKQVLLIVQSMLDYDCGRGNLEGVDERVKHKSHHNRHSRLQSVHIQCVGDSAARQYW